MQVAWSRKSAADDAREAAAGRRRRRRLGCRGGGDGSRRRVAPMLLCGRGSQAGARAAGAARKNTQTHVKA